MEKDALYFYMFVLLNGSIVKRVVVLDIFISSMTTVYINNNIFYEHAKKRALGKQNT
ncbi:hypothetical protein KIN20_004086 [Parelaphostrongylus tenuis]|uniref:Uncharacterized protein n=1 Tax=Parelaphostrongylus tenuis TaxID=148309 RepID=A0AAD5LYA2_PARTN|nr:hypothetical protein KIN20_004086 [Parelaphostrongylus tenuis]